MQKNQILDLLRESKSRPVSGEEISKLLKVSRTAIWKEIQMLRKIGYVIEAQPHLGYRLLQIPDKMFADEIHHGLKTELIGKEIISYDEIDSTNDASWKLGEQGVKEGFCIFAERQKKGRGRLGRQWESAKSENILLSILLRPNLAPQESAKITLMAGVSAVRASKAFTTAKIGIKWPNDLLCENQKCAGILTEMSAESDRVKFVVVGIGININSDAKSLPPGSTSLKMLSGSPVSRQDFARKFLECFEEDYLALKSGKFDRLAKDWETFSATTGKRVSVSLSGKQIQGTAQGIDADGALWVRTDNGLQEKILAGDVQHLR